MAEIPFHQHTGVDSPSVYIKNCTGTPKADYLTLSTNLKASADAEQTGNGTSYTKVKEIEVYRGGTIRITFEGKYGGGGSPYPEAAIYLNGVLVQEYTLGDTSYEEFVRSTLTVTAGSKVQLYAKSPNVGKPYFVQNFRLYWDFNYSDTDYIVNTD